MAFEVVMPRLGWTMETGSLAEWHKKDGDYVEAGEILFSVESEKAVQEVETLESGILRIPPDSPSLGEEVPVGTVLGYLVKSAEAAPFEGRMAAEAPAPTSAPAPTPAQAPTGTTPTPALPASGFQRPRADAQTISPRAKRVALELGVDWETLTGSGRNGRIEERDVRAASAARGGSPA
jgi:pyruvate dehydrogenase E2 component (dihydrolipoamide acetyltransferase)